VQPISLSAALAIERCTPLPNRVTELPQHAILPLFLFGGTLTVQTPAVFLGRSRS